MIARNMIQVFDPADGSVLCTAPSAGVFEMVTGDPKAIGAQFTSDDRIRKISFIGSTAVGKLPAAACGSTL